MWDLIVSVPDHCLSFYLTSLFMIFLKTVWKEGQNSNRYISGINWNFCMRFSAV